jgi:hypothetical protein
MEGKTLPQINLNYKPEGHRGIGRPKTRWIARSIKSENGIGKRV